MTGLRGFAALSVLLVHVSSISDFPWIGFHTYGPTSLFVLSGFLLFKAWSRWMVGSGPRPSIGQFIRRRLWRIFPPYLVFILVAALVYPASRPASSLEWVQYATLTNIYVLNGLRPGAEQTWSLGTELSWYALLPIAGLCLGWVVRRFSLPSLPVIASAFAASVGVVLVTRWFVFVHTDDLTDKLLVPMWLPSHLAAFIGGAAVAHLTVLAEQGRPARAHSWLIRWSSLAVAFALCAGLVASSRLGGPWAFVAPTPTEHSIRTGLTTVMALTLLAAVAGATPSATVARIFSQRWLVAVGRWSYGIFLWHLIVIRLLEPWLSPMRGTVGWLLLLSATFAISAVLGAASYRFIEVPSMKAAKTPPLRW